MFNVELKVLYENKTSEQNLKTIDLLEQKF